MKRLAAAALATLALAAAKPPPRPVPATDLLIRQASPALTWRWRAAPEAALEPALLRRMRTAALADAARARGQAARDAAAARKAGVPLRRYETIIDWTLAAETPRLLALAGQIYSFTGGAHGNTGYATQLWDRTTDRPLTIDALFTDWPRARRLIEPLFCKALATEQKARRAGEALNGEFDQCPKLSEQPIIPWAGLAARAPQFRVLLGPYVAGPYSEGAYLVTANWPEGVRALVKPAYRDDLFGDPSSETGA